MGGASNLSEAQRRQLANLIRSAIQSASTSGENTTTSTPNPTFSLTDSGGNTGLGGGIGGSQSATSFQSGNPLIPGEDSREDAIVPLICAAAFSRLALLNAAAPCVAIQRAEVRVCAAILSDSTGK